MFRDWFGKKERSADRRPAVRRMKSFSAQSGYVYQYVYLGQRPLAAEAGAEFVFSASADRKSWHDISVLVEERAVRAVGALAPAYALFNRMVRARQNGAVRGFRRTRDAGRMHGEPVRLRAADVAEIMERLGRD